MKRNFSLMLVAVLAASWLCGAIPATALDGESSKPFSSSTTALVESAIGDNNRITIESYLTNKETTEVTIKPCDIIFVIDQSKWMNTADDNGQQRAVMIESMKNLLSTLSAPTTGGEHRVAIAGYGRVNVNGGVDPYTAEVYPGQTPTSGAVSFNTGYYTTNGFISRNGWTEVKDLTGTDLPQMPQGYLTEESYENTFMSLSDAETVLNPDTMMAWYAGASRMDAGLTIAEQLAQIATSREESADRDLIVCIMASSLPIQNTPTSNTSVIRNNAVLEASNKLKEMGATIFAFGDYHASGKVMSGSVQDTAANFTKIMEQVCSQPDYFFALSDSANVTESMNKLITQITITSAGEASQEYTIRASEFTVVDTTVPMEGTVDESGVKTITWKGIHEYYADMADELAEDATVRIEYYNFTGYDENGAPTFEDEARVGLSLKLIDISTEDEVAYDTTMIPLPPTGGSDGASASAQDTYGYKVVIRIAFPLEISYKWAVKSPTYAPSRAVVPADETIVLGSTHNTPTVRSLDNHYIFEGWYLDEECTQPYDDGTIPTTHLELYGKWSRYVLVEYFWNIFENSDYDYPDASDRIDFGTTPDVYTPSGVPGYEFVGWYTDRELTQAYEPDTLTLDLELFAKWVPSTDTAYTVVFYQQNLDGETYTEMADDTLHLTGTTDSAIAPITQVYTGFTLDHITYEDTDHDASAEELTIAGDGSLVVSVYFNRETVNVIYDLNGGQGAENEDYSPLDVLHGTDVTVKQEPAREGYAFLGWRLNPQDRDTAPAIQQPGDTLTVIEDIKLVAQWESIQADEEDPEDPTDPEDSDDTVDQPTVPSQPIDIPQTGDKSMLGLAGVFLLLSLLVIAALIYGSQKQKAKR